MKVIVTEGDSRSRAVRESVPRVVAEPWIAEAHSFAALEGALLANPDTDVILVDSCVVDVQGFAALVHLCVRHPSVTIAITSSADGATIVCRSLASDSSGAMPDVSLLSPQQLRVLMSLASGLPNKSIAKDLGVTEATIKAHMTVILRKLGLERRTQAALLAQRILRGRPSTAV